MKSFNDKIYKNPPTLYPSGNGAQQFISIPVSLGGGGNHQIQLLTTSNGQIIATNLGGIPGLTQPLNLNLNSGKCYKSCKVLWGRGGGDAHFGHVLEELKKAQFWLDIFVVYVNYLVTFLNQKFYIYISFINLIQLCWILVLQILLKIHCYVLNSVALNLKFWL